MTPKYPQVHDRAWLVEHYSTQGLSSTDVARMVGCTPSLVQQQLKKFGIKARGRYYGRWKPKQCERCAVTYTPSGPAQRFCSWACQAGTVECVECGKEFVRTPPRKVGQISYPRKYCSWDCRRSALSRSSSYRWLNSGGYITIDGAKLQRNLNVGGYVRVSVSRRNRVLEHRWVMEQAIGRALLPHETVHHINGVKTDNRLDLQLRSGRHGNGVASECLDCGSFNIRHVPLRASASRDGDRPADGE